MRHVPTLIRRELAAYFLGPMAYLILLAFQGVAFLNFYQLLETIGQPQSVLSMTDPIQLYVAGSGGFWLAILVSLPLITMRLLAEERRSGTIETLLTAPVTETEVVVAKWLAGVVMYLTMLATFLFYLPFLRGYGQYPFDLGPFASLGIGLTTMGMMLVALGLFFSALTKNQIVAAILTFAALCFVLILSAIEVGVAYQRQSPWLEGIRYLTLVSQMRDFGLGQLDLRYVALHLSASVFLIYLTVQTLKAKREG